MYATGRRRDTCLGEPIMSARPSASKSELEIARIVWELGEATLRQVYERIPADRQIDIKTVQTYLRRLEAKGYLKSKIEGRQRLYRQRVQASKVVRENVNEFVDQLFGGEVLSLMQHLVQDRGLTRDEVDQLRDMLTQWEEKQTDEPSK